MDNLSTHQPIIRATAELTAKEQTTEQRARTNLIKVVNAVNGMQSISAVLASYMLIEQTDRIISHTFKAYNPWNYALKPTYAQATDEEEDAYNVLPAAAGGVAMGRASDDFVHRPDQLQSMPPFVFHMMAAKEKITGEQPMRALRLGFKEGHPQHATHCLRIHQRPQLLQVITGIPTPPTDDGSLEEKDVFAGWIMGSFVAPDRLHSLLPDQAHLQPGNVWTAYTTWMAGPNGLFDAAAKQMVRNIISRALAAQEAHKAARVRRSEVSACSLHAYSCVYNSQNHLHAGCRVQKHIYGSRWMAWSEAPKLKYKHTYPTLLLYPYNTQHVHMHAHLGTQAWSLVRRPHAEAGSPGPWRPYPSRPPTRQHPLPLCACHADERRWCRERR